MVIFWQAVHFPLRVCLLILTIAMTDSHYVHHIFLLFLDIILFAQHGPKMVSCIVTLSSSMFTFLQLNTSANHLKTWMMALSVDAVLDLVWRIRICPSQHVRIFMTSKILLLDKTKCIMVMGLLLQLNLLIIFRNFKLFLIWIFACYHDLSVILT